MEVKQADPNQLIEKASKLFKQMPDMKAPEWAMFVKTGHSRERQPMNPDWWHVRQAAVLRKILLLGPVGVSKLRKLYGGRKNMGMAPEHFYPGSGSVIRKILQQLEKAGFAKQTQKGTHKGRIATPKGIAFLDKLVLEVVKTQTSPLPPIEVSLPKPKKPVREPKVEPKKEGVEEKPKAEHREPKPHKEHAPEAEKKKKRDNE